MDSFLEMTFGHFQNKLVNFKTYVRILLFTTCFVLLKSAFVIFCPESFPIKKKKKSTIIRWRFSPLGGFLNKDCNCDWGSHTSETRSLNVLGSDYLNISFIELCCWRMYNAYCTNLFTGKEQLCCFEFPRNVTVLETSQKITGGFSAGEGHL